MTAYSLTVSAKKRGRSGTMMSSSACATADCLEDIAVVNCCINTALDGVACAYLARNLNLNERTQKGWTSWQSALLWDPLLHATETSHNNGIASPPAQAPSAFWIPFFTAIPTLADTRLRRCLELNCYSYSSSSCSRSYCCLSPTGPCFNGASRSLVVTSSVHIGALPSLLRPV